MTPRLCIIYINIDRVVLFVILGGIIKILSYVGKDLFNFENVLDEKKEF